MTVVSMILLDHSSASFFDSLLTNFLQFYGCEKSVFVIYQKKC